jgi:hypothetical protein
VSNMANMKLKTDSGSSVLTPVAGPSSNRGLRPGDVRVRVSPRAEQKKRASRMGSPFLLRNGRHDSGFAQQNRESDDRDLQAKASLRRAFFWFTKLAERQRIRVAKPRERGQGFAGRLRNGRHDSGFAQQNRESDDRDFLCRLRNVRPTAIR